MRPLLVSLAAALAVAACASTPTPPAGAPAPETEEIVLAQADESPSQRAEEPAAAPCKVRIPPRPGWPLDDPALAGKDLYVRGRAAINEIELRRAYEARLEAALLACTRTPAK
jgi:hypothetical protein